MMFYFNKSIYFPGYFQMSNN